MERLALPTINNSGTPTNEWSCNRCTLLNTGSTACAACDAPSPFAMTTPSLNLRSRPSPPSSAPMGNWGYMRQSSPPPQVQPQAPPPPLPSLAELYLLQQQQQQQPLQQQQQQSRATPSPHAPTVTTPLAWDTMGMLGATSTSNNTRSSPSPFPSVITSSPLMIQSRATNNVMTPSQSSHSSPMPVVKKEKVAKKASVISISSSSDSSDTDNDTPAPVKRAHVVVPPKRDRSIRDRALSASSSDDEIVKPPAKISSPAILRTAAAIATPTAPISLLVKQPIGTIRADTGDDDNGDIDPSQALYRRLVAKRHAAQRKAKSHGKFESISNDESSDDEKVFGPQLPTATELKQAHQLYQSFTRDIARLEKEPVLPKTQSDKRTPAKATLSDPRIKLASSASSSTTVEEKKKNNMASRLLKYRGGRIRLDDEALGSDHTIILSDILSKHDTRQRWKAQESYGIVTRADELPESYYNDDHDDNDKHNDEKKKDTSTTNIKARHHLYAKGFTKYSTNPVFRFVICFVAFSSVFIIYLIPQHM
jgi:hypothetical protein